MAHSSARVPRLLLVLASLIIAISIGIRQSLGIYMPPMTAELGISAATFGFAIAVQNIVWGVSQPFVGALADRYGPRPVLVATALMYGLGLVLMTFTNRLPGALQIAGLLAGIGTAGTGFGVLIGTVSRATPQEKRTRTVGMVAAAASLGTFVIAPLGQFLIDHLGWKGAMLGFGALAASIVALVLPMRDLVPASAGAAAKRLDLGEAVRQAMLHRGYLYMTLAFFACGFQLVFITTHLPTYLAICGVAPGVGATALGLVGLFNAVGTYTFGILGTRYSQKHLLAMIYLARTCIIGVFLAVPISPATVLIFAASMGLLWLGVIPLVTGIIGRVFGLAHFNTLYGIVFLSHQVGSFFGAWMGGLVFTNLGNYNVAWGALIVIGVTAFTLQWLMDEKPPRESGTPGVPQPA